MYATWLEVKRFPKLELESGHSLAPMPHPFPLHRDFSSSMLAEGFKRSQKKWKVRPTTRRRRKKEEKKGKERKKKRRFN